MLFNDFQILDRIFSQVIRIIKKLCQLRWASKQPLLINVNQSSSYSQEIKYWLGYLSQALTISFESQISLYKVSVKPFLMFSIYPSVK